MFEMVNTEGLFLVSTSDDNFVFSLYSAESVNEDVYKSSSIVFIAPFSENEQHNLVDTPACFTTKHAIQ